MRFTGIIQLHIPLLIAVSLPACVVGPHYSLETNYPGTGVGIVEARSESPSTPVADLVEPKPDFGEKYSAPAALGVFIGRQIGPRTPRTFHYQVRSSDGTLHIIGSEAEHEIGSCVAFSGFADGPSRTHWSSRRVTLEKSTNCVK